MIGGPSKLACEGATRIMNEVHDIINANAFILQVASQLGYLGYAIVNGRKGIGRWDGNTFCLIWTER